MKRIFFRLSNIYRATVRICGVSAGVAAWCGAALVFMEVIARYVFNYGVVWAVEYTTYLTVVLCFIGAVYTQWVKGHISIDIVVSRLPKRAQQWLEVITLSTCLVLCLMLVYWGSVMLSVSIEYKSRMPSAILTPTLVPQSPMVLGFFLLTIVIIVQLIVAIRGLYGAQAEK